MNLRNESGSSSVEAAIIIPVLVALSVSVWEGSVMLKTFFTVQEAAREGAREILRSGSDSKVQALVQNLTKDLPPSDLQVSKSVDTGAKTATVEVSYAYQPSSLSGDFIDALNNGPLTITSKVVMPLQ
ncbi:hypothetical protein NNJEOMEG_03838 [Fundidesulfovibrio magnetotacticus]|uniref:TadE-like domain-containing protein n=1 Tax=Fundidesulfovibrio magnetotacticus TaxID=2730080 RepID=A0A6V8M5U7_9BACT|nr:TadE/TadG family type IV pilus assembly protein [Fundidesulfovibrio magnetotacticus]GFK95965.1 hypothetical protein NNJEOMEG_03838 [Fundidesulfovibrio magnetotacticus]